MGIRLPTPTSPEQTVLIECLHNWQRCRSTAIWQLGIGYKDLSRVLGARRWSQLLMTDAVRRGRSGEGAMAELRE